MQKYARRRLQTRGQMQMGEMVLVLVVAFVIGVAALTFFIRRGAETDARQTLAQATRDHVITAKEVANLPGIRYSLDSREDVTVIDMERARAFELLVSTPVFRGVYRERFSGYKATLTAIYPPEADYTNAIPPLVPPFSATPLVLFDYTDSTAAARNSVPFIVPVLLYEPSTGATAFGILEVIQVQP